MSGVGRQLLTGTSCTSAAPVLVTAKPCVSWKRYTALARATVTYTVPTELPVLDACPYRTGFPSTNVSDTSESQPSTCQAGGLLREGNYCYASDSMKRLQQSLPEVPNGMQSITNTFLSGAAAVAATGQLQRAGYDWVHGVLIVMAWQHAMAAQQKIAKSKQASVSADKSICETQEGLDKAIKHLHKTAASFSWQLLNTLNDNGYKSGLAYEQLPLHFQLFSYSLLLKCGCIGSWGQPVYRELPAVAATIRPGRIVAIPINDYLRIVQHAPRVCRDEMDGTWCGDAQVRIHPFQVVSEVELAKALGPDRLLPLFESGSGFAADLATAAANMGVVDGAAAAAACNTSSTSSLAEVLLLKFSKACVGISAAVLANMRRAQQQEASSMPSPAAPAVTGNLTSSPCCLTCACGGAGGSRRGSLTAVASDDFDDATAGAGLVPMCKGTSNGQEECTMAATNTNNGSRRGLLHSIKSFVRRFHKH